MLLYDLGVVPYRECLGFMEEQHRRIAENPAEEEAVIVVQHPPVVTMGNRNTESDMSVSEEVLQMRGIDFVKCDRGGSVTVHEPGQCVVYPLVRVDAKNLTVKKYVHGLEEVMIRVCARYAVSAARDPINPGVWVGKNKIGALGIRISNHVTKHGIAFNVTNSLSTFDFIVPCGIRGRGVTTLERECKGRVAYAEVQAAVLNVLRSVYLFPEFRAAARGT